MIELIIQNFVIILLFFFIATLYSSVGFGGGSSYLAILALSGLAFSQIRSIALLCNIIVVSSNVFLFFKQKQYNWKKIIPLILMSIPMAFLGGYISLNQQIFFILLGFTLIFASIALWFSKKVVLKPTDMQYSNSFKNATIGGGIGLLSGLVGIGGGIFLAPFLHLTYWDSPKRIAAVSSLFILVNSLSGFTGQLFNNQFQLNFRLTTILLLTVFIGSIIGNKLRNSLLSPILLKKVTAILVLIVGIRVLINQFL